MHVRPYDSSQLHLSDTFPSDPVWSTFPIKDPNQPIYWETFVTVGRWFYDHRVELNISHAYEENPGMVELAHGFAPKWVITKYNQLESEWVQQRMIGDPFQHPFERMDRYGEVFDQISAPSERPQLHVEIPEDSRTPLIRCTPLESEGPEPSQNRSLLSKIGNIISNCFIKRN